ncbi:5'-3' exonuclease [Desulfosporosinus shakirovi]|uniref:5'-3' exonuclease n=1 Tax=Desulfosporosinus shakirovi TaxID=2885154 RepID=UPI001E29DBD9|nr:5'-3' exonuclease [Desulfosporosinus sp. SRJS8]MCB8818660.1 5'-3' exonuclease [Desulfosporosinus sp. SRJS8]
MILLIDANNLLAKSFYGRHLMYDAQRRPIHAVSGVVHWVLKFYYTYKPKMIVVCWDSFGPTFRHQLYPAYKANRKPTPSELLDQIPRAKKALENLGIAQVEIRGYEADDIIGTLAQKSKEFVRIVSGDRDLFQLINRNVMVDYLRARKVSQQLTLFKHDEIFGIDPGQWVDFKALVGDSSDNITGVSGIGEKTVWPLLKQGLTLKDLLEYPDILPVKTAKRLVKFKDQALLSWRLAKIDCTVPVEIPSGSNVDVRSHLSRMTLRALGLDNKIA